MTQKFLVEEIVETISGDLAMPFRHVVEANTAHEAFMRAEQISMHTRAIHNKVTNTNEPQAFMFASDELTMTIPGVLWEAADGSMIKYEVRTIP